MLDPVHAELEDKAAVPGTTTGTVHCFVSNQLELQPGSQMQTKGLFGWRLPWPLHAEEGAAVDVVVGVVGPAVPLPLKADWRAAVTFTQVLVWSS